MKTPTYPQRSRGRISPPGVRAVCLTLYSRCWPSFLLEDQIAHHKS